MNSDNKNFRNFPGKQPWSFLGKLQVVNLKFHSQTAPSQVFSGEFSEIFRTAILKNYYFCGQFLVESTIVSCYYMYFHWLF